MFETHTPSVLYSKIKPKKKSDEICENSILVNFPLLDGDAPPPPRRASYGVYLQLIRFGSLQ